MDISDEIASMNRIKILRDAIDALECDAASGMCHAINIGIKTDLLKRGLYHYQTIRDLDKHRKLLYPSFNYCHFKKFCDDNDYERVVMTEDSSDMSHKLWYDSNKQVRVKYLYFLLNEIRNDTKKIINDMDINDEISNMDRIKILKDAIDALECDAAKGMCNAINIGIKKHLLKSGLYQIFSFLASDLDKCTKLLYPSFCYNTFKKFCIANGFERISQGYGLSTEWWYDCSDKEVRIKFLWFLINEMKNGEKE